MLPTFDQNQNNLTKMLFGSVWFDGKLLLPSLKLTASFHLKMDGWKMNLDPFGAKLLVQVY